MPAQADLPVVIDEPTLDLVEKIRGRGFNPAEIMLMTMMADVQNTCRNRKEYAARLKKDHGVEMSVRRIGELQKNPEFQECVSWLFEVEQGHMLRSVQLNMYRKAADPRDPHAVAAARLIFQVHGMIGKGKVEGGGGGGGTYGDYLRELRKAQRAGQKVTVSERTRSITIGDDDAETPSLPAPGTRSLKVVPGDSAPSDQGQDQDPTPSGDRAGPDPEG